MEPRALAEVEIEASAVVAAAGNAQANACAERCTFQQCPRRFEAFFGFVRYCSV